MGFYLSPQASLKWLETPSVYQIARDELYELDQESFRFLSACASSNGCGAQETPFIDYCLAEGLLTRELVAVRRPQLTQSPDPSLRYLELQITDRCNLRCKHCYIGEGAGRELSVAQVRGVLREFEEMQGLRVLLTGGEPLLHSRFDEINEMLPELFLRTVLFTNGMLLDKSILRRLKVHEIQVSVDGMLYAHERLRGTGTWEKALYGLRSAIDAGLSASVSTMVTSWNLQDFDAMEELFRSLGVREWTVDVPCRSGNNAYLSVDPEAGGKYLAYGYGGGMHSTGPGYACGLHLMAVLSGGTAAKCTFYGDRPVGTLADGLRSCWQRIRPIRLADLDCACEFVEVCRGGCRYRAETLGNPSGRDLYRCSLYGILDKPA